MSGSFHIKDESGDRKYFTIVPNYVLNHSTANAQALYLQLKRLAGENGVAYPGSRFLMSQLRVSYPTLRKEFRYLLEKGWIEFLGEKDVTTDGGPQKVKAYRIKDLWKLNIDHYERGEKIDTPCAQNRQRGVKIATEGVKKEQRKKNSRKEEPIAAAPLEEFSLSGEIQKLEQSPRRDLNIIGYYFRKRSSAFDNAQQFSVALKRHLRAAKDLVPFPDEQITAAAKIASGKYPEWTIETLVKLLTK